MVHDDLETGRSLYRRVHRFAPPALVRLPLQRTIPPVLVQIGELRGLIYRSDREQPGRPRSFIHFMETPARLACDPTGRQLYIVGGSYRVTPRGIEG